MNVSPPSPQRAAQIVAMAIEMERRCAALYEEWARRFKPYDRGIAQLLEELAAEEHRHAREFQDILRSVATSPDAEEGQAQPPAPGFDACLQRLRTVQDHFFVTGPVMAGTILEAALDIERFTRRLYRELGQTDDPQVAAICRQLAAHEDNHVQILQERLEFEKQKP